MSNTSTSRVLSALRNSGSYPHWDSYSPVRITSTGKVYPPVLNLMVSTRMAPALFTACTRMPHPGRARA